MKLPITITVATLLAVGCTTRPELPVAYGCSSRRDWIAQERARDPKHFSFLYGWIDARDGIDADEALAIANLYFDSSGVGCGAIVSREYVAGEWIFECGIGYGGTRVRPIRVDARTGAVWQKRGERIDDTCDLLRKGPNQSPEPTPGTVTPRATVPRSE